MADIEEIDVEVAYPEGFHIGNVVASLILSRDDEHVETIGLRQNDRLLVGRKVLEKDETIVRLQINDPVVSKDQFRVYMVLYDDDDQEKISYMFYCEDLETLNGTDVNGIAIGSRATPGAPFLLSQGDKIFVQPNWNFVFHQIAGSSTAKLSDVQREDSLYFKDRYHLSNRCLGAGQYSKVLLATDVNTKKQLACKVMNLKAHTSKRERERLLAEVNLLGQLNHPNIVTLQKAFESDESLFLFLDLAQGGDLMSFVAPFRVLPEAYALVIVRQITLAIDYLHSKGVVHRDLKMENILVMNNDIGHRIVVADFGCAAVLRSAKRMDSFVGTKSYLAPEIAERERQKSPQPYTKAVDLWSLGVLTFALLTGEVMNDSEEQVLDQPAVQARLAQVGYGDEESAQRWSTVSSLAKEFMAKLLVVDPLKRMTARDAARHAWFTKDKKLERELLKLYDRANKYWKPRVTVPDILERIPGGSRDVDGGLQPKTKRLPNSNASRYFGLDKHLRTYDQSQRENATRTKQELINQLKESGQTFVQTRDMSTYTPKKTTNEIVSRSSPSQDLTRSPRTPRSKRVRIHSPRPPAKDRNLPVIREVAASNLFADTQDEDDSPSNRSLRQSQITTQGEYESQMLLSQSDTHGSLLINPGRSRSPSADRGDSHSFSPPFSSPPFSIIHSLSIRQKSPDPESVLPPDPTGASMEIEELLQQQFSSANTEASMPVANRETLATRNEKRKLQVFEDDDNELPENPFASKKRASSRYVTLTQEDKELRRDVLKAMPLMTTARVYGQKIKERKQGLLATRK